MKKIPKDITAAAMAKWPNQFYEDKLVNSIANRSIDELREAYVDARMEERKNTMELFRRLGSYLDAYPNMPVPSLAINKWLNENGFSAEEAPASAKRIKLSPKVIKEYGFAEMPHVEGLDNNISCFINNMSMACTWDKEAERFTTVSIQGEKYTSAPGCVFFKIEYLDELQQAVLVLTGKELENGPFTMCEED